MGTQDPHQSMKQVVEELVKVYKSSDTVSKKLLLIDDHEADAVIIYNTLLRAPMEGGFEIHHAMDFKSGMEALGAESYDLVLLDFFLPDQLGLDGIEVIREEHPDVAIILLTGLKDDATTKAALKKGAQDFLFKDDINSTILKKAIDYAIERQRSKVELENQSYKYRYIFENSLDAIYISSVGERNLTDFNKAMLKLLGYTKEELMELNMSEIYDDKNEIDRFIKEMEEKGRVKDFKTVLVGKIGQKFHCLINSTVRKDKAGNIIGYQGIIRDITDQVKSREALEGLNKVLEKKVNSRTEKLNEQKVLLESQNEELKSAVNAWEKARLGRKTITIVFIIAIILFVLAEGFLEPRIDRWALEAYGGDISFWVGLGIKAVLLVLLKPIEFIVEATLRKQDIKQKMSRA